MAGLASALHQVSPWCACSGVNGFSDTNLLRVFCSAAKRIAAHKSPTTNCYKSIKHLQLSIQPPATFSSWACKFLWPNSCTVNCFHMCSHHGHLERQNPSPALPYGQPASDQGTTVLRARRGTLGLALHRAAPRELGRGQRRRWCDLWLTLTLLCPWH